MKKRSEDQNDLTWIVFANSRLIIDTMRKDSFEGIWDGRILCLSKYWPEWDFVCDVSVAGFVTKDVVLREEKKDFGVSKK